MRICLFTKTALPNIGGQELVIDALAKQFQQLGHEVVTLAPPPSRKAKRGTPPSYPVFRHPRYVSTRWLVDWYGHWLRQTIRKFRCDLIHCHDVYACGYLAVKERQRGGPSVVITSHGGDVRPDNPRFRKPGLRQRHVQAIHHADALISISDFTTRGFLELAADPNRIHAIPNGVEVEAYQQRVAQPVDLPSGLSSRAFFLFLGRLAKRKGVDVLLEAYRQFSAAKSETNIPLVIAGAGLERSALETFTRSTGLNQLVHFLGNTDGDKKRWLLQNTRALIMPTREWEAFPLVLLEGYAAGCPVIASDAPGLVGLVAENDTGWIVPRENPNALAQALQMVCEHPQESIRIGQNNQKLAKNYSWRIIAQRHIALFEQVLGNRRQASVA